MNTNIDDIEDKIAIIGLGYVGLPLAIAFSHQLETIGYDLDPDRISELGNGYDRTNEVSEEELKEADQLRLTNSLSDIADCTTFVITVPTPVDTEFQPDLSILVQASESVGSVLKGGDTVIYESTVYPGATEEICSGRSFR